MRITHPPFFLFFLPKSRNIDRDFETCVWRPSMKGSRRPAGLRVFAHFPLLLASQLRLRPRREVRQSQSSGREARPSEGVRALISPV